MNTRLIFAQNLRTN